MTGNQFDQRIHHRRSIRLQGFDYTRAGAYFVTIVAHGREYLFGEVVDGEMVLNRFGEIVDHAWFDLPRHYRRVSLGAFVIMPNHVHGIIILNDDDLIDGRGGSIAGRDTLSDVTIASQTTSPSNPETRPYAPVKRHPLSEIVRAFKSFSAKRINVLRRTQGIPVWQRNYYEHIIRNSREMELIWNYIEMNPSNWAEDEENISHQPLPPCLRQDPPKSVRTCPLRCTSGMLREGGQGGAFLPLRARWERATPHQHQEPKIYNEFTARR